MDLKDRIRAQRKKLGLTLEQVGDAIGVSKVTVMRYEKGEIENMGRDKIYSLAKVLQVTPSYLMGWEEQIGEKQEILECKSFVELRSDIRRLIILCSSLEPVQVERLCDMVRALRAE